MDFIFIPPSRLGEIQFGMSRSTARKVMNCEFREFKKTEHSRNTTDSFRSAGVHIFYDENNTVKGVEVFPPSQVFYSNNPIIGTNIKTLIDSFKLLGIVTTVESSFCSICDNKLRFGASNSGDGPPGKIDSVYAVLEHGDR